MVVEFVFCLTALCSYQEEGERIVPFLFIFATAHRVGIDPGRKSAALPWCCCIMNHKQ
jgi:hypothetical protein